MTKLVRSSSDMHNAALIALWMYCLQAWSIDQCNLLSLTDPDTILLDDSRNNRSCPYSLKVKVSVCLRLCYKSPDIHQTKDTSFVLVLILLPKTSISSMLHLLNVPIITKYLVPLYNQALFLKGLSFLMFTNALHVTYRTLIRRNIVINKSTIYHLGNHGKASGLKLIWILVNNLLQLLGYRQTVLTINTF